MRCLQKALTFLLPSLAATLVIPGDSLPAARERVPDQFERSGAVFEYNKEYESIVKFSLPCDECEDEEKKRLEEEVFTVSLPYRENEGCSESVNTGVRFNGQYLLAEQLDLNKHRRWAHPSDLHFENSTERTFNADWELTCACIVDWTAHGEEYHNCPEYGYTLALQIKLGEEKRRRIGFTLTYDQHTSPSLMRFSPFVEDISAVFDGISLESIHQTKHWASPMLIPIANGIHSDRLEPPEEVLISTFSTSTLLQAATGTPQVYLATATQAAPSPFTSEIVPVDHVGAKPSATPESHSEAEAPSHDPIDETYSTYTSQVRLHTEHFLGSIKHGLGSFEEHAGHAAQAVIKQLQEHMPHSHIDDGPAKASKTSPHGAIETRDSDAFAESSLDTLDPQSHSPNPKLRAFQLTSVILLLVAVSGGVFAYVRRDPRVRADIAARCEERRNRRLYRHAARRQRVQNLWNTLRGRPSGPGSYMMPHSPTDPSWEEKEKGFAPDVDAGHGHIKTEGVGEGLKGMRKAQRFVDGILRGQASGSGSKVTARQSRHYRSYSLSESEKSIPPTYEEASADTIIVVDGLSFVSSTIADRTPDSSVIDTSSRNSSYGSSDDEKD